MSLLQTMCRLFGSRCAGEPEPTKESMRTATTSSQADLGQKEAEIGEKRQRPNEPYGRRWHSQNHSASLEALTALALCFPHRVPRSELGNLHHYTPLLGQRTLRPIVLLTTTSRGSAVRA